jgi:excisionase family DNA binding protein
MTENDTPWMTTKQAAAYLQVSATTLHELKERGEVPSRKIGNLVRYHKAELDEYLLSQRHRPGARG